MYAKCETSKREKQIQNRYAHEYFLKVGKKINVCSFSSL